jgi:comEA protein
LNKSLEKIEKLIEKYKVIISLCLLILIVFTTGYLFWYENSLKPSLEEKINLLEKRISLLENSQIAAKSSEVNVDEIVAANNSSSASSQPSSTAASAQSSSARVAGLVNINTANASELDALSGIGPVYAQRIIDYRNQNNGFKSKDEVLKVKGIGPSTYNKFKDKISI